MLPIPMTRGVDYKTGNWLAPTAEYVFLPQCDDPIRPSSLGQGLCAGEWMHNVGGVSFCLCVMHRKRFPMFRWCPFSCRRSSLGERGTGVWGPFRLLEPFHLHTSWTHQH